MVLTLPINKKVGSIRLVEIQCSSRNINCTYSTNYAPSNLFQNAVIERNTLVRFKGYQKVSFAVARLKDAKVELVSSTMC